jgi:DNA-directed RNA polymerase specialized sigma24 family protein
VQRVISTPARASDAVNEQSFTELLVPLVQPAYRLACAMLHDASAAEDVVQEASLIAWRKLGRLDQRDRLKAWFLGIVANECRNTRRRRWWNVSSLGLGSVPTVASGEDRIVNRADVRNALRRLSHEDREPLFLSRHADARGCRRGRDLCRRDPAATLQGHSPSEARP